MCHVCVTRVHILACGWSSRTRGRRTLATAVSLAASTAPGCMWGKQGAEELDGQPGSRWDALHGAGSCGDCGGGVTGYTSPSSS
jgi:hypothetical protein